jgi:hypothetical protein
LAPAIGLAAMLMPLLIWPPARHYRAPLFPILREAIESMEVPQLLFFVAAGALLGLASKSRAWLLAAAAVSVLPLVALAEMVVDPTSHNLIPLEFMFYAFYGFLVWLGIVGIRRARSWGLAPEETLERSA